VTRLLLPASSTSTSAAAYNNLNRAVGPRSRAIDLQETRKLSHSYFQMTPLAFSVAEMTPVPSICSVRMAECYGAVLYAQGIKARQAVTLALCGLSFNFARNLVVACTGAVG